MLKRLGGSVGIVLLLLLLMLLWLLLTGSGLRTGLALTARLVPGELSWESAEGRLAGPLEIRGLHFSGAAGDYRLQQLELDWSPRALAEPTLWVERLHLQGLQLAPAASGDAEPSAPAQPGLPDIRLPLRLVLRDVRLEDIEFLPPDGGARQIERLQLALEASGRSLELQQLELALAGVTAQLNGSIALAPDASSRLAFDWMLRRPDLPVYAGTGTLRGNLETLTLEHQLQQPAAAQLSLQLDQPLQALQWSLELSLPLTRLERFAAGLPPQSLELSLQASGDLATARLQASLNTDHPQLQGEPLTLQARLSQEAWNRFRLEASELQLAASRLQVTGDWALDSGSGRLALVWPALHWPPAAPAFSAADGRLVWEGGIRDFVLDAQSALTGTDLPQMQLELHGRGDVAGLRLEQFRAELLAGVVEGAGRFGWRDGLDWELDLDVREIDPGRQWPDWPGQLAAGLQTRGAVQSGTVTAAVQLQQLDGRLRGLPIAGAGGFRLDPDGWRFDALALRTGANRLTLNGGPGQADGLLWALDFPELADTLPHVHGTLQGQGRLHGAWPRSRLVGELRLKSIDWADLEIEQADLGFDAGLGSPEAPLQLSLNGSGWQWQARELAGVTGELTGSLADHRLQLTADGPSHGLQLALAGGWREPDWSGRITRFDWNLPETGAWTLQNELALRLGPETARLETACWQQDSAELCLEGNAARAYADWQADLRLERLPLNRLQPWLPVGVEFDSALSARATARRSGDGLRSEGRISLPEGTVAWDAGEARERLPHGAGELDWQLDTAGLQARARLGLLEQDELNAQLSLPGFRPGVAPATQTVTGSLRGDIRRLEVIELFVPAVTRVQGWLDIDSRITGSLAAPELRLGARLQEAALWVPAAGIHVEDIAVELASAADGQLRLRGGARSGAGRIGLDGTLDLTRLPDWRLQLDVQGEDFLVLDIPEARLPVSPDLELKVQPPRIDLAGRVHIPEARLAPRDFSGAVGPSRDVVVVTDEAQQTPRWSVHTRVTLSLGEAVMFEGYGLTGRLAGRIELIDEPGQLTRARGELQVVDGSYAAYGQTLDITQGRVIYSGGPVDNPALDATAVRQIDEVTAGLRLGGFLQDPQLELFSRPAMAEGDVLSYLMLGRPMAGASGAEGQLLMRAATAMGVKGGNALAGQIGETLGLDEVSVSGGGSGGTAEDTSLVLGKYLSPRLYVNYSVGLFEHLSTLNLRYELSRRWSLESELGVESGVDLLFNIER
ncbi:translocation/assembly module TamB domain-containing protein [Thiohalobacter sp. COW1]|uniref:translocation/assembly module TamB domain-containing protein n=1 Tax=Thiohalobacter sp. COW1 TaxID=2795687 RepID=UPI0019168A90|nr:translocation/assembly module TamB domain-containing protein [Thiohalobacter sp. COW1]